MNKLKLPYFAGIGSFGAWAVFRNHNRYGIYQVESCKSEQEARDAAYQKNGEWLKEQKK